MLYLGFLAMCFVQGCHVPQLIELWRLYRARIPISGVSPAFYWLLGIGLFLYLVYAIHRADPVYIVSNVVGLIQVGFALWIIRRSRSETRRS